MHSIARHVFIAGLCFFCLHLVKIETLTNWADQHEHLFSNMMVSDLLVCRGIHIFTEMTSPCGAINQSRVEPTLYLPIVVKTVSIMSSWN